MYNKKPLKWLYSYYRLSRKEKGFMEKMDRVRHRQDAMELIECYLQKNDVQPNGKLPAEREMGRKPEHLAGGHPPID